MFRKVFKKTVEKNLNYVPKGFQENCWKESEWPPVRN